MSNSLCHIHVIHVAGESAFTSSQIALFFEDKAFLTYDLPALLPESVSYSRRCIDNCDGVVMVVGSEYGETNASGVSQLHLSYLVAKTKLKPILVFVRKPDDKTSRRTNDLIKLIQKQESQVFYYQHETVIQQHLENVYADFEQQFVAQKWVREQSTTLPSMTSSPTTKSSMIKSVRQNSSKQVQPVSISAGKYNDSHVVTKSDATKNTSKDTRFAKLQPITTTQDVSNKTHRSKDVTSIANNSNFMNNKSTATFQGSFGKCNSVVNIEKQTRPDISDLILIDELTINYKAHAYKDGNLSDVSLSNTTKWVNIIRALARLNTVFSTDIIYRCLNDLVSIYATDEIKKTMPNVHAVSRCQVCQLDFEWICNQLIHNNWIESVDSLTGRDNTVYVTNSKKFWRLTDLVKNELNFLENMS